MNATNTVVIEGREYVLSEMSQKAQTQVVNLRVVDEEIRKLEQQLAIFKTARAAYARALKQELEKLEGVATAK